MLEIKSRSLNRIGAGDDLTSQFWTTRGTPRIRSGWLPYLEDVTFQWLVLSERYPEAKIIPTLVLLDSSQPCPADNLYQLITTSSENGRLLDDIPLQQALSNPSLVLEIDVTREVDALLPTIQSDVDLFLNHLTPSPSRIEPHLSARCRDCEYRITAQAQNGFRECWGETG
ncbi:MAG: hypothetical protein R3C44_16740 [Chloroflexota bacterium]